MITQDFARSSSSQPQLVGVAYYDNSATHFYQPGEGQGGLQIDAVNVQTGQVLSTQTWSSGGYELALPAGQYRIIASLNDKVFQTTNVTVGNVNIEQDFVLSNSWQGGTRESAIAAAQPAPIVVTPTPAPAPPHADSDPDSGTDCHHAGPDPDACTAAGRHPASPAGLGRPAARTTSRRNTQKTVLSLLASSWSAWNAR